MTYPDPIHLAGRIHAVLPQTQCTRCGYPDCMAYAEAIAKSDAAINQCPPGGAEGVARLADITGRPSLPLNPANGLETPRTVAVIDEAWCIGCTLCQPVCPTDAILGSNKMMHTVIEPHCTGCELCIAVCPVDCISLEIVTGERTGWQCWTQADANAALTRYTAHQQRTHPQTQPNVAHTHNLTAETTTETTTAKDKQSYISAVLSKARARR